MNEVYHDKLRNKDVRKAQNEKFNWISSCGKNYRKSKSDVSINCIKSGDSKYGAVSFTFRNDVWQFFGERVEFAIYKNRILFRNAAPGEGLAFSSGSIKCPNKYIKIRITDNIQIIKDKFIGDYELKYDSFYELYYIEANFKA